MITAILIDDEKASLVALEAKLMECKLQVKILEKFQNPLEALQKLKKIDPDLVFLDIDMPVLDGFGFLDKIPNRTFEVIFTTAYNEYAISAIKSEAFDFLLKPINQKELEVTLERIHTKINHAKINSIKNQLNKISVPTLNGLQFLDKNDIVYLLADKNYTTFFLENKEPILVSKSLREYEKLEAENFFRIHHSTLINLNKIVEYIKGEGGTVVLTNGHELEVSRRRKSEFLERFQ